MYNTTAELTDFSNANFANTDLSSSDLVTANFTNANLTSANLSNSNLNNATDLDTATLTGVTWSNTVCPDNTNSNDHSNTCIGHLVP